MTQINEEIILSSILGFVIGDALGVPVEFKSREDLTNNPVTDMRGFGTHNQPKGTWSDDSSMVLATIDSINETQELNYADIMKRFLAWYENGKYTNDNRLFDIGFGTRRALEKYKNGTKAEKCGSKDYNNNGNGSLMRMLPVVLFLLSVDLPYNKEVEATYYTSSLTHAHDISLAGCKIYTDYIRELIATKNPRQALENLKKYEYNEYYDETFVYSRLLSGAITDLDESQIKSSGYIVHTLEAAIWCLINSNSFEEAVLKAVNLGSDTDTIAALTGSLAGILYGYKNIPERWISQVRNIDYVLEAAKRLSSTLLEAPKKKEQPITDPHQRKIELKKIYEQMKQMKQSQEGEQKKL